MLVKIGNGIIIFNIDMTEHPVYFEIVRIHFMLIYQKYNFLIQNNKS